MQTRKIPRILGSIDIPGILYEKEGERKGKGGILIPAPFFAPLRLCEKPIFSKAIMR
jgi:hypothetical protein